MMFWCPEGRISPIERRAALFASLRWITYSIRIVITQSFLYWEIVISIDKPYRLRKKMMNELEDFLFPPGTKKWDKAFHSERSLWGQKPHQNLVKIPMSGSLNLRNSRYVLMCWRLRILIGYRRNHVCTVVAWLGATSFGPIKSWHPRWSLEANFNNLRLIWSSRNRKKAACDNGSPHLSISC